jgi:GGDEF domain-containing protein
LHRAVVEVGLPPAFLGHIGGDDFIIVCTPEQMYPLAERAVQTFEEAADALYDPVDAERGYLELEKRNGEKQKAALVTLSIGVAQSVGGKATDPRDLVAVASEMKAVAKTHNGSYVAHNRRGGL